MIESRHEHKKNCTHKIECWQSQVDKKNNSQNEKREVTQLHKYALIRFQFGFCFCFQINSIYFGNVVCWRARACHVRFSNDVDFIRVVTCCPALNRWPRKLNTFLRFSWSIQTDLMIPVDEKRNNLQFEWVVLKWIEHKKNYNNNNNNQEKPSKENEMINIRIK